MKSKDNFFKMQNEKPVVSKYDNIVFDVNNYYHKSYHVYNELTHEVGNKHIVTGGIYGFLKTLNRCKRDFLKENGHIYFLFDNPDSKSDTRQLSIDPTYKSDRKKYSQPFYRGLDYLRLILMNYDDSSTIIYGTGFEADDLAPNVLNRINENETTLVFSEDLDWTRLIDYKGKQVHIYMGKKIFDKKAFNEKYNFVPSEKNVILYKVIRGDTSDNIPVGIPNISSKLVEKLIGDYDDIFDIIENIEIIPYLNKDWKKKILERKARLRLNHQLVSFIPVSDSYLKQFTFYSKFKPQSLIVLYRSLGFTILNIDGRMKKYVEKQNKNAVNEKAHDTFFKVPEARRE